jgi:hypothetical protein
MIERESFLVHSETEAIALLAKDVGECSERRTRAMTDAAVATLLPSLSDA